MGAGADVALGEIKSPAGANGALFDPLLLLISTVLSSRLFKKNLVGQYFLYVLAINAYRYP